MNYIDTHCDTAFEMFKKKEPLSRAAHSLP